MNSVAKELFEKGDLFLLERPEDIATLRTRFGTRSQNFSVQIYAYTKLNSSVDLLYQLQDDCRKEDYDLATVVRIAVDWLSDVVEHAPVHYRLDNTAEITARAVEELKAATTRSEVRELLQGLEHYYNQVRTWIDLEFPWHELSVCYAQLKGDPPPRGPVNNR